MTLNQKKRDLEPDSDDFQIALLEEKLQVTRQKQKLGEIVVRKEVETKTVQIPIRREKLIVEKVGENSKNSVPLAETVLGSEKVCGFTYEELQNDDRVNLSHSHYLDLATAQKLLQELASLPESAQAKIRIEIATNSDRNLTAYQEICDRHNSSEDS